MAILANHVATQVVFPRVNGLPEDSVVMTFHFKRSGAQPFGTDVAFIHGKLDSFFNVIASPATKAAGAFISDQISRTAQACHFKSYDMGLAPPHAPNDMTWTLIAAADATSLPGETALCLSYKSLLQPGVPIGRQRGRVYFGPLCLSALAATESGGDARPLGTTAGPQYAFVHAFNKMKDDLDTLHDIDVCVYSTTGNALYPAAEAWVDDAFDVQRRRGAKATSRFSLVL